MTLFFYFLALFSVLVTVYATNDVYDAYDTHMSKMRRNWQANSLLLIFFGLTSFSHYA
jgi:hypothetical protein